MCEYLSSMYIFTNRIEKKNKSLVRMSLVITSYYSFIKLCHETLKSNALDTTFRVVLVADID